MRKHPTLPHRTPVRLASGATEFDCLPSATPLRPFSPWPVLLGNCYKCLSCPPVAKGILNPGSRAWGAELPGAGWGGLYSPHLLAQPWPLHSLSHSALPVSSLPPVSSLGISERGPWMPRASWGSDPMLSPLSHELLHSPRCPGTDCTLAGSSRTLHVPWSQQMSGSLEGPTLKRRGGVVDHRDVILAHQAHKVHSTPRARRKEWE